jgi:hypothetical protein
MARMSRDECRRYVIETIQDFVDGKGGDWDWGDFISCPLPYAEFESVRGFALELPSRYPPHDPRHYCGPEGLDALRAKARELEDAS